MWLDWLVFCDYGFSVSALWCPPATPNILLGFLLPWTWGISSRLLQQNIAAAPYLGRGVSPHRHPSWSWTWNSSSRPSCNRSHCSLEVGLLLSAAAPGLRLGVSPPGRHPNLASGVSPLGRTICTDRSCPRYVHRSQRDICKWVSDENLVCFLFFHFDSGNLQRTRLEWSML